MVDLGIPSTKEKAVKGDPFFDVQLIRRGKDHPNLPAANYTFKTYYIDSMELFERYWEEIKTCCDMFGLRAYVSVNAKSKKEARNKTCERMAHNIVINESRKPWKDFASVCGGLDGEEKRWVVDVDDCENICHRVNNITTIIRMCESGYEDNIVTVFPTRSGFHIITHPFNLQKFKTLCAEHGIEAPEIKKNHITLLYENL
jgi:hypothetical protein